MAAKVANFGKAIRTGPIIFVLTVRKLAPRDSRDSPRITQLEGRDNVPIRDLVYELRHQKGHSAVGLMTHVLKYRRYTTVARTHHGEGGEETTAVRLQIDTT